MKHVKKIGLLLALLLVVGWTVYDTLYDKGEAEQSQGSVTTEERSNEEKKLSLDELRDEWLDSLQIESGTVEVEQEEDAAEPQESVGPRRGEKAPDFSLVTLTGERLALSDLKGKKVLLNFWATWCPPCRAEMPDMQKLYEDMGQDEMEIVAVNLTQSELKLENVDRFVQEYGLTFPVLLDEKSEVAQQYLAITIPTSYVIDSEGIIRQKKIGPMSYEWMKDVLQSID